MKRVIIRREPGPKESYYKTAYATISCAHFKAGDCVSVRYYFTDEDGMAWYNIDRSQHGLLPFTVAYPAKHLKDFCL